MTYVNRELADKYQDFFNFMNQEHNLILTKEEMDEILSEAERLVKKLTIHDVGRSEQLVCDHPDEAIIRDKPTDYCLACNSNI